MDFTKFRTLDMKLLDRVDKMLSDDIAKLMVRKFRQKPKITFNFSGNGAFGGADGSGKGHGQD